MLDIFQKWKDKVTNLVETRVRLLQLELIERVSGAMSFLVFAILFLLVGFAFFLFIGLGVAEMLSKLFNDNYFLGYSLVALAYLILLIIFYAMRKNILKGLSSKFISVLTEKRDDDDDEDNNEEEEIKVVVEKK